MVIGRETSGKLSNFELIGDYRYPKFLDLSKLRLREINFEELKLLAYYSLKRNNKVKPLTNPTQINLSKLEYLNLDDNELTALPSDLFNELTMLKTLSIRRNKLKYLPNQLFSHLTNLEKLHLDNNKLESLSDNIFKNLFNLRVLSITSNRIVLLSQYVFSNLSNLRRLFLNFNFLETLPVTIFNNLGNLKILFMKNNRLQKLNEAIFDKLYRLQRLNLTDNDITLLPDGIFKSQVNLRVLFIDIHKIDHLPSSLAVCDNLETLSQKYDENDYSFIQLSIKDKFPKYVSGDHYSFIRKKEEISKYKQQISILEGVLYCIECGFENIPGNTYCKKCNQPLFYE